MVTTGLKVGNLQIPGVLLHSPPETSAQVGLRFGDRQLQLSEEILAIRDRIVEIKRRKDRIVGKGASFCWAEVAVKESVEKLQIEVELGRSEYFNNLLHTVFDEDISETEPDLAKRFVELVDVEKVLTPQGIGMHPLSSGVGLTLVLLLADGQVVLTRRSMSVAVQPGKLHTATAEALSMRDLEANGVINLNDAVYRSVGEELGVDISENGVHFFGLAVDLNVMWPGFIAQVKAPLTWKDVALGQIHAPDKWEHADVWPVRFNPEVCAQQLKNISDWTGFGSLALTLSLIREFGEKRVKRAFSSV